MRSFGRWLLSYVGLGQPHRPERILALLVSAVLAICVGSVFLHFLLDDEVTEGTPRWWYFVYLAGLISAAVVTVRWPRLAAVLLSLATLEVVFGIGTAVLYKFNLSESALFPRDYHIYSRSVWHPLLQAVPIPSRTDDPEELRFFHNSQRQRGPERSAESLQGKKVIALFGGSTTYDVALPENETWAHQIETMLGVDRFAVINHGLPGFTTVENLIQTAFYGSTYGVTPRCSIYYLGWNDLRNSHIRNLDPGYADYHLPSQVDAQLARRLGGPFLSVSPTLSLAARLVVLGVDTVRPVVKPPGTMSADPDPALEAIFVRNIRTISAIDRSRGIRTLWVGQVMDRERLAEGEPYGWIPFLRVQDIWPLIQRLNSLLKREASALGDVYVDIPSEEFTSDDFADHGHFEAQGALKFARILAPAVAENCR